MAYEIVWTDNAGKDAEKVIGYLKDNWSQAVAENFIRKCNSKVSLLESVPFIGVASEKNPLVRRILITKHNALYYSVVENRVTLLNIFDTRQDPEKRPH